MLHKNNRLLGFTLVELSIVIIIIGFLVAGISAGRNLIKQAELNAIINEIQSIKTSLNTFKLRYNYLPGDLPNATSYWPSATTANGDGNGYIDSSDVLFEDTYVLQHLSLTGLVKGNFVGGIQNIRFDRELNCMPTIKQSGCYEIATSLNGIFGTIYGYTLHSIQVGSFSGSLLGFPNGSLFSVQEASAIDTKMDDGVVSSGNIMAHEGVNVAGGSCTDGGLNDPIGTVNYVLSSIVSPACRMFVMLHEINP